MYPIWICDVIDTQTICIYIQDIQKKLNIKKKQYPILWIYKCLEYTSFFHPFLAVSMAHWHGPTLGSAATFCRDVGLSSNDPGIEVKLLWQGLMTPWGRTRARGHEKPLVMRKINIYTFTYTYTYTYIYIYIYTYIFTYIHKYIYTYIHIYIYAHIHTYTIYIYIYTCIHIYMYTKIHIYIFTYTHLYKYRYTYLHIYILTYMHVYV